MRTHNTSVHKHDLVDTTEMYLRTILELEEEGVPPLRARRGTIPSSSSSKIVRRYISVVSMRSFTGTPPCRCRSYGAGATGPVSAEEARRGGAGFPGTAPGGARR